ncbi:hypothetical protein PR003_g30903, partial [Phytophthora rubi]
FCSLACVRKFFNEDSEPQELTPSSTFGISCASDATVIDLAQTEVEREPEPTHAVPSHIKGLYADDEHENNAAAFTSTLAQSDGNSSSENESDLIFGDEVSQPATETTAEATLNAKADALLDEWMDFRVDWVEVAKLSTGSFVMSQLRTRTDNERAQRQLLLHHNRNELRRMEEGKRQRK